MQYIFSFIIFLFLLFFTSESRNAVGATAAKKQNSLATAMAIIAIFLFSMSQMVHTPVVTTITDATGHIITTYSARAERAYFSRESTTVKVS